MGWRQAPKYIRYMNRCRAEYSGEIPHQANTSLIVDELADSGVTSFRTPETASLAERVVRQLRAQELSGLHMFPVQDRRSNNAAYNSDVWLDFPDVRTLLKGPIDAFLRQYYRSYVKYYFGKMYRSSRMCDEPTGSQLWHSDSGPGTCINVMVYLSDVGPDDGPLQVLPWGTSLPIFLRQPGAMRSRLSDCEQPLDKIAQREILCRYHEEQINAGLSDQVRTMTGPAGTVIPFFNNSLHRGGFPDAGHSRIAIVFHCYPSHRPTNWAHYDATGLTKRGSYPSDPAEDF